MPTPPLSIYYIGGLNGKGPGWSYTHVRDLGVSMSSNCTFDFHISNLYKRCSNLAGWILRTFTTRDPQVMLTLYKTLVMSRLEYASQLWSPYLLKHVYLIERVQRAFTKHISGMCFLSYSKRLEVLKLYSLQRRRERYGIIYVWKMIEGLVPNLSDRSPSIMCAVDFERGLAGAKGVWKWGFLLRIVNFGVCREGLIDAAVQHSL